MARGVSDPAPKLRSILQIRADSLAQIKAARLAICDALIVDLGGVRPEGKRDGRAIAGSLLYHHARRRMTGTATVSMMVRLAEPESLGFTEDGEFVGKTEAIDAIVIPATTSDDVDRVASLDLPRDQLIIECRSTSAAEIAAKARAVGIRSLIVTRDRSLSTPDIRRIRSEVVSLYDGPFVGNVDPGVFHADLKEAERFGYSGKVSTRVSELALINSVFGSPSENRP